MVHGAGIGAAMMRRLLFGRVVGGPAWIESLALQCSGVSLGLGGQLPGCLLDGSLLNLVPGQIINTNISSVWGLAEAVGIAAGVAGAVKGDGPGGS